MAVSPILGTGVARAGDAVRVTVTPAGIAPGRELRIRVEGCAGPRATATSKAFVADAELAGRDHGRTSPLSGGATIRSSAAARRYEIDVSCDGRGSSGSGSFRVVAGRKPAHPARPAHLPATRPGDRWETGAEDRPGTRAPYPAQHSTPVAPVRARGGGSATLARDQHHAAERSGPGTPHVVTGLVLAGVAAVTVAFRSARRQRSSARDTD
jgi:hypothetical protein